MKKLLQTLILVLAVQAVFGQCQALFSSSFSPANDSLYLWNQSYSTDSSQIVVNTYNYTVYYGGMSYTSTGNPAIFYFNGYTGPVYACLTITTSLGCTSTYCDSIYPQGGSNCIADFSYMSNTGSSVNFFDQSIPEYPSGTFSYYWTFTGGMPASSTLANPVVAFPGNGVYNVCLTVNSDSGCTATYCTDVYVSDSMQNNCMLLVSSNISNVSTIGGSDGFIDMTVTGGTPPYLYVWNTGATTQDIYGLTSGIYTVTIIQSDTLCPATSATFQVSEPYDTIPLDTLYAPPIDTCLNFLPDSFYVAIAQVDSLNATVTWTFTGNGAAYTVTVVYPFQAYGPYVIALTFNCDSSKGLTTYMTYINITQSLGVPENATPDFTVYPNPFNEHLDVEMPGGITEVMIYNNMGQLVWSAAGNGSEKLSIDAASWPAGFYMIRLQGTEGNASKLLIRQ